MRIVFATTRGAGHTGSVVAFARASARAGHDVLVAGPESARGQITRAGLPFHGVGEPEATERQAAWAPVWSLESAPGAAHVIQELFIGLDARAALPGMRALLETHRPDLVVRETCEFASLTAAAHLGVPQAQIGVHLVARTDADEGLLALAAAALDEDSVEAARHAQVLTCAPASLDAAPGPARLRRFRDPTNGHARPALNGGPPLVYVSFGSEAPRSRLFPDLYREVAHALAALPVRVLMTIGDHRDPADLGPLPPSVRVERWVAQAEVMPHAAAMVGHGGSGSTLAALAAGVPLALIPLFVDGPENAARVAEIGAGIVVERDLVGLTDAVAALLEDPRYRAAAGRVADEISALPPVDAAFPA